MKRVVVLGPPCSGKTTTARAIADRLDVPHVELDALWWEPDWTEAGATAFSERLREAVAHPAWVMDGNYFTVGTREVVHPLVDTFVWLDFGRWITVPRALCRTYVRALTRTELWSGNREPVTYAFRPVWLLSRGMRFHPGYNREVASVVEERDDARWFRFQRPADVDRWLANLT